MTDEVFLNFPFDPEYETLYLTLVAGLTGLGLRPRSVLELPDGGQGRLTRIRRMLWQTRISIHELGWVRIATVSGTRVPRFNMPFELGLAAMLHGSGRHEFFVLESVPHRLQLTLSDLNGIDPLIHRNDSRILLHRLLGAFRNPERSPSLAQLVELRQRLRAAVKRYRVEQVPDLFSAEAFRSVTAAAFEIATSMNLIR